ncbi:Probable transposase [Nitrosomonas cryotolerans]|uniref:Probable transposase n=1 Tax=Nitrosomonas cryotolerans ATCC 49181 TaxID=1131553 RepID=A0A1N6I6N3_9PROT|nr:Probable transposase [Nitrosomonas cryotolerans]SIO27706.1 Probable transposase [Nitrosomonas cryotolerans ATCC 49181]
MEILSAQREDEIVRTPHALRYLLRFRMARCLNRSTPSAKTRQSWRNTNFSNNWKKQEQKIARLHQWVACSGNDFLHKTSNRISKNHAMIVIEGLKVTNMSKSAAGSIESPGRSVKAKIGLNNSILDQGWGDAASWNTSKRGVAVMCLPSIRVTQAGRVRPATMCPFRIAQHNPSLRVSNVGTQKMQISTQPSIEIFAKVSNIPRTGQDRTGHAQLA